MVEVSAFQSLAALTSAAANDAAVLINQAIVRKGVANIVLTGGTLGIQILGDLAKLSLDLENINVVFSDERFVPLDAGDRNEHQALSVWPDLIRANLLRYPEPVVTLVQAQLGFESELQHRFRVGQESDALFDLAILGMGPDGHVASLFPGHNYQGGLIVSEADSPKPPAERLSLSYQALNSVENVFFLAAGTAKAEVAKCAIQDFECDLPAAKVQGKRLTRWYLDEEISREL